jgi:molybdopterin molybdotransferase
MSRTTSGAAARVENSGSARAEQTRAPRPRAVTSPEAALEHLLSAARPVVEIERIGILRALARVLAEAQYSTLQVPPSDNSAMDGYVVVAEDIPAESEARLPVVQRIPAGKSGEPLQRGTAARIFTGGPIPAGGDAVVMQERCRLEDGRVCIRGPVAAGQHVRRAGEDIASGERILEARARLRPQDLGLAASVGLAELPVFRKVRAAIFSTGDELREPGVRLTDGALYNSNRYTLHTSLAALGCEVLDLGIVRDGHDATRNALSSGAAGADLVITTGGVSVGEEDHVRNALQEIGELDFWRIAIKPGKPLAFGHIGATPFLGLPGNPVAAFVTFCLFARPFILRLQGMEDVTPIPTRAPILTAYATRPSKRCEYIRARLERDDNGSATIAIHPHQGSGVLSSTSWANGLVRIPADTVIEAGTPVEFLPFAELLS